jgi:hypothetical protein
MLSDNVDALHARSSNGIGSIVPLNAALGPRSCSGDGDGGGRADPLRGGGDNTVICCGERSGGGTISYGACGSVSGGKGNENAGETMTFASASGSGSSGGTVATGVSPSRWRKSASGAICAMRSPIGVTGIDMGISSAGRTGGRNVVIGGGGGVARPEGALRIRRRCLNDVVRAPVDDTGVDDRDGDATGGGGGGGSGPVGGGLGGTSNAGGMP